MPQNLYIQRRNRWHLGQAIKTASLSNHVLVWFCNIMTVDFSSHLNQILRCIQVTVWVQPTGFHMPIKALSPLKHFWHRVKYDICRIIHAKPHYQGYIILFLKIWINLNNFGMRFAFQIMKHLTVFNSFQVKKAVQWSTPYSLAYSSSA